MTHITSIHIENVKRVKALRLEPTGKGLTVVGGRNGQGKTSVLDAVAWALGGAKFAPSDPQREGSMSNPAIALTLSNGLKVERKGRKSSLTVIDPSGKRAGQALLDAFVSEFALDLPKFLSASDKEKAQTLLRILGIGDQLAVFEQQERQVYEQRHALGQIRDSKQKHAAELPEYADAPAEPVSISELIQSQQATLARNGENQRKRNDVDRLAQVSMSADSKVRSLEGQLVTAREEQAQAAADYETARKSAQDLRDESTAEVERQIASFEGINAQVAANQAKAAAADEAAEYAAQYAAKSQDLDKVRADRLALLEGADLPLPGLTIEGAELLYNGQRWDCMSGSEQLHVGVAIVRRLSPDCSFVLMDRLEQMDIDTLKDFGTWLEAEGLQVIATRVSTGDECSIVIEDGLPAGQTYADVVTGVDGSSEAPAGDTLEF